MTILAETRPSDSAYIEAIMRGRTIGAGTSLRPAECHWHLVFIRHAGWQRAVLVGPWTSAGEINYGAGAEILWIKFKLGAFLPGVPVRSYLDSEVLLPDGASSGSFWLENSVWSFPDFENVETFVERLVRQESLARDPLVPQVLQGRPADVSARTVRHRFQQAAGISPGQIQQYQRALQAAQLLENGTPILEAVFEAGYYDQPHLTRALKHWIGLTPGQISYKTPA